MVDWRNITECQILSEAFINKFSDKIDWEWISYKYPLSESLIDLYANRIDWNGILSSRVLTEDLLDKHQDKMNWGHICLTQILSEDFIEKHADKVDWNAVSKHQNLSESFIEKYANKVNWNLISRYQRLGDDFIKKFEHKIDKELLANNWFYKSVEEKKREIEEPHAYECHEDFFYAYIDIRRDRRCTDNLYCKMLPGETYVSNQNKNTINNVPAIQQLFTVSRKDFIQNCLDMQNITFSIPSNNITNSLIVKCKVYYKDVTDDLLDTSIRVNTPGNNIKCTKVTILE